MTLHLISLIAILKANTLSVKLFNEMFLFRIKTFELSASKANTLAFFL